MILQRRAIFHLSFPVSSLEASLAFYQSCLGASVGRHPAERADVVLFGHQLTLHNQPSQVWPREARGLRHFGSTGLITDEELSKLTGRTGVIRSRYGGRLHNGNTDVTVTSITISVTGSRGNNATSRKYRHEVNIPPLAVRDFGVDIISDEEDTEYQSDITSARGHRE